jgi:hypothetical protein
MLYSGIIKKLKHMTQEKIEIKKGRLGLTINM